MRVGDLVGETQGMSSQLKLRLGLSGRDTALRAVVPATNVPWLTSGLAVCHARRNCAELEVVGKNLVDTRIRVHANDCMSHGFLDNQTRAWMPCSHGAGGTKRRDGIEAVRHEEQRCRGDA